MWKKLIKKDNKVLLQQQPQPTFSSIRHASSTSIIDDTVDTTPKSQCSVIVRYIDMNGMLVEGFLGFYDVTADQTAQALCIFCY